MQRTPRPERGRPRLAREVLADEIDEPIARVPVVGARGAQVLVVSAVREVLGHGELRQRGAGHAAPSFRYLTSLIHCPGTAPAHAESGRDRLGDRRAEEHATRGPRLDGPRARRPVDKIAVDVVPR